MRNRLAPLRLVFLLRLARDIRRRPAAAGLLASVAAILLAGCGGRPEVEVVQPRRGEIRESFSEPARTRLSKTYVIAMPVAGRIGRIDLEPGDPVATSQTLAQYDLVPLQQTVAEARAAVGELQAQIAVQDDNRLENTARVEMQATIDATQEALNASQAEIDAEKARSDRASKELTRVEELAARGAVAQNQLDDTRLAAETSLISLRQQEFVHAAMNAIFVAVQLGPRYIDEWLGRKALNRVVYVQQLAQAQARLVRAEHDLALASIRSPIEGVVLERYEQGDNAFEAGRRLLLLGRLADLEAVADVLTQDALRLRPGAEVRLEPASDLPLIAGRVKRIEPAGFTKLSSLGVEQQRVNVIVSLEGAGRGLGVGYRLQARFFTGVKPDALIVPRFSVLQAPDQSFYVFKETNAVLKKQPVRLGLRSDLEMEVVEGLSADDAIVKTPDSSMNDGDKISPRLTAETGT